MVDTGYTWKFIREQAWGKDGKPTDCEKPYITETTYKPTTTTTSHGKDTNYGYGNNDRIPPHAPPKPQKGHKKHNPKKLHTVPHHPKPKPLHGDVIPTHPKEKNPKGDVIPTNQKHPGQNHRNKESKHAGNSPSDGTQDQYIPVKDRRPGNKEFVKEAPKPHEYHPPKYTPKPKSRNRQPGAEHYKGKYQGPYPYGSIP